MKRDRRLVKSGNTTVEFLLVLPSFLVIVMLLVEFCFLWIDRHYLRLAAFESARVLTASELADPCSDKSKIKLAERKAWQRMAAVSLPIDYYLPTILTDQQSSRRIANETNFLDGFTYLLKRLPVASQSTTLHCEFDREDPRAVTVELVYRRVPFLPFARDVLWGLYLVRQTQDWLRSHRLEELFSLDLDNYYFKVVLHGTDFEVPDQSGLKQKVYNHAQQLSQLWRTVPWRLRSIPMIIKLRLVKPGYKNYGQEWKNGKSLFVAPFNNKNAPHWREWATQMAESRIPDE